MKTIMFGLKKGFNPTWNLHSIWLAGLSKYFASPDWGSRRFLCVSLGYKIFGAISSFASAPLPLILYDCSLGDLLAFIYSIKKPYFKASFAYNKGEYAMAINKLNLALLFMLKVIVLRPSFPNTVGKEPYLDLNPSHVFLHNGQSIASIQSCSQRLHWCISLLMHIFALKIYISLFIHRYNDFIISYLFWIFH